MNLHRIIKTLFGPKVVSEPPTSARPSIKSQAADTDLEMTAEEKAIVVQYDALPRTCRRLIEIKRPAPKGWLELLDRIKTHTGAHTH